MMYFFCAALLLASGGSATTNDMQAPTSQSCHIGGSCESDGDDEMLIQISRASAHEAAVHGKSTAANKQLIKKLQDMVGRIISGEEKITDATRIALDTIDDEMDSIIENAKQNKEAFQGTLDRAKEAIEACGSDAETAHTKDGGINALAAFVNSARTAHNDCRTTEASLKVDETTKCSDFDTYVNGLTMPTCSCSTASDLGVSGFKTCIESMREWSTNANATWTAKSKLCTDATSVHSAKRQSCNTKQGTFESDFCSYEIALTQACSTQKTCRSTQIALRNTAHASVKISESALKAEYESAKRVKCILGVLNATDSAKKDMLAACVSAKVETGHLDITYDPVPDAANCVTTPVDSHPCDDAWNTAEFNGKSWMTDAPLETCVPCYQATASTTEAATAAPTVPITQATTVAPTTPAPTFDMIAQVGNKYIRYRPSTEEVLGTVAGEDYYLGRYGFFVWAHQASKTVIFHNKGNPKAVWRCPATLMQSDISKCTPIIGRFNLVDGNDWAWANKKAFQTYIVDSWGGKYLVLGPSKMWACPADAQSPGRDDRSLDTPCNGNDCTCTSIYDGHVSALAWAADKSYFVIARGRTYYKCTSDGTRAGTSCTSFASFGSKHDRGESNVMNMGDGEPIVSIVLSPSGEVFDQGQYYNRRILACKVDGNNDCRVFMDTNMAPGEQGTFVVLDPADNNYGIWSLNGYDMLRCPLTTGAMKTKADCTKFVASTNKKYSGWSGGAFTFVQAA